MTCSMGALLAGLALGASFLWDRWQRSKFVKQLTRTERGNLQAFENFAGGWRKFRLLQQSREQRPEHRQ
jgi:hypothetical protein